MLRQTNLHLPRLTQQAVVILSTGLVCLLLWVGRGWGEKPTVRLAQPASPTGPFPPAQAQKLFKLPNDLHIQLVASDPQIESPVAMTIAEDGKMWVVEMRDYPNGPGPNQEPEGRIKVLEDRDGDGFYETSTLFADKLLFANGLLLWDDGALVTSAPHLVYLQDTDRDGKADKRTVLYEGFAAQNPQLRVSNPILGLDGFVYVANGLRGGEIVRAGDKSAKPLKLQGMDFRFQPLNFAQYEACTGMGQFGNTFDDWGRRFVCDNRHHLRHIALETRYLQRNPVLSVVPLHDPSALVDGPLSSGGKVYPLSKNWTTSSLHVGRFTAACGVHVYRGDLLPKAYQGSAFTCEPTGNLVHQEVLAPAAGSFRSQPPQEGVEFLATPDDWFRPVHLSTGPDGALYVVDMYRAVIEHPEFMPTELKQRPDLLLGKDKGRIWKIVPAGHKAKPVRPLSRLSPVELVKQLEHPNAWQRTTAQRLILQGQDRRTLTHLQSLVQNSTSPLGKVHAAWLLENFGVLETKTVKLLLGDKQPRVREQALLLAELHLTKEPGLTELLPLFAKDVDARVRFQAALSLGSSPDKAGLVALADILLAEPTDRFTRAAVHAHLEKRAGEMLTLLCQPPYKLEASVAPEQTLLLHELAGLVGARQEQTELVQTLNLLATLSQKELTPAQLAGMNGLAEGLGRRGTQLSQLLANVSKTDAGLASRLAKLFQQAVQSAENAKLPLEARVGALKLLAHVPWTDAQPALLRTLRQETQQELRLGAVRAMSAHNQPEVAGLLLQNWRSYTPTVRREVSEALLRQQERTLALLQAIAEQKVKPGDLDPVRTRQLVNHSNRDIRAQAVKLLQESLPADRKQVLAQYQAALKLKGDPEKGKAVFQKQCATCHRVAALGQDVGPDIADTRTKTPDQLLVDILNPNQAIDNNYINYTITTKQGKSLTGVIANETANSLTLRRAENQTDVVLRQDIDEMQSTGVSLMPEGLEKTISLEEMAHLLSFLKNWRYLDGQVPIGPGKSEK